MKNTKMKYKIFFVMMLLLTLLNNASAVSYVNGSLHVEGYATSGTSVNDDDFNSAITDLIHYMEFHYNSETISGIPYKIEYNYVSVNYLGAYADLPQTTGGCFQIWDGTTEVGTGNLFITKESDKGSSKAQVRFLFYFDTESFIPGDNKIYTLKLYTHVINNYYGMINYGYTIGGAHPLEYGSLGVGISPFTYGTGGSNFRHTMSDTYGTTAVDYTRISNFRNDYSIKLDSLITTTDINRNFPDNTVASRYVVRNSDESLFYQSGYTSSNTSHGEITNITQKYYIQTEASGIEHLIYSYTTPATPEYPTLTTDKLLYNTSEQITISFTNIDEIEVYAGKSLSLYILYPVIDDRHDYEAKYMLHLYGDRRDENFTLNTSFLSPQNVYHLAICIDGDFHQIDDSIIISDTFFVYSDDEYLNTNCDPSGNCYTYNGGDISIYYKINNNSNIIIKDNEGNTIQTYYNIIGENELNYNIPEDLNKLNSYPNWKIYLNNTEYETNYTTDVTVYWSLITTPTPTPIYTSVPKDENVSEMVDELKEESKPIFDLIYGLSELVVDNPDYDDDNIITENEMNNWFNSLIPIVLILLIFIVYTGLTKKR